MLRNAFKFLVLYSCLSELQAQWISDYRMFHHRSCPPTIGASGIASHIEDTVRVHGHRALSILVLRPGLLLPKNTDSSFSKLKHPPCEALTIYDTQDPNSLIMLMRDATGRILSIPQESQEPPHSEKDRKVNHKDTFEWMLEHLRSIEDESP